MAALDRGGGEIALTDEAGAAVGMSDRPLARAEFPSLSGVVPALPTALPTVSSREVVLAFVVSRRSPRRGVEGKGGRGSREGWFYFALRGERRP